MAHPSSEGRSRRYDQHPSIPASSSIGSYCSETSSSNSSHWHPGKQCDHGLRASVKYAWTIFNPGCRFACCPKEQEKQCGYMSWVDPEWDERAYVVMVKLMKKKMEAEEHAKKWEEDLGKAKWELGEIRKELKTVQQQLQKSTAQLNSIQDYRHNVKLAHVLLAIFVVVAGWMLGGKAK